jgi:hypothetical protein
MSILSIAVMDPFILGVGNVTVGNVNAYQEYFNVGKGGRYVGLTILPP